MRDSFIAFLKQGKFKIPVCASCHTKVWPPSSTCSKCLSATYMKDARRIGKVVEFSHSHVKDMEGIFALVNLDQVFLLGSIEGNDLRKGMTVRMSKCGLQDGRPFYRFIPVRSRR